jgi:glycosyltransferase involved in cell wall biosynthesis
VKVLALTRYSRSGASSRARFFQYVPSLAKDGIQVTISPLFTDRYVASLQQGQREIRDLVRRYAARLRALRTASSYDLLWIEKDPLPWLPAWFESMFLPPGTRYVVDYDDAVFHTYDLHRSEIVRRTLGRKHSNLMRASALVLAGNKYLADYSARAGAACVEILPTTVDLNRYSVGASTENTVPVVGWIGQHATARFLQPLAPMFNSLAAARLADFAAVGIDPSKHGLPMRGIEWTEDSEVQALQTFDIGVMPLEDGPFERGKCGYKLIQYMACGLPVVASPVGVNSDIVEHGVNGFLAQTEREWAEALQTLASDAALRRRLGAAGREKVERSYSLQSAAPRLAELLRSAAMTSRTLACVE